MIDRTLYDLVIFDCDGVLVDSEPLSNAVMAEHITQLGWSMTGEQAMARFKGRTMAQVHALVEAELGRTIDPAWRDAFHRDQRERMKAQLKAIPGIYDLIDRVHATGLQTSVASQGRHEKMAISLGVTELLKIFEGRIFSAVDVARPKPFPDLFLHVAKQMGVTAERCLVIEDSPTGIEGALAAGMTVIGYDATGGTSLHRDGIILVDRMDKITFT